MTGPDQEALAAALAEAEAATAEARAALTAAEKARAAADLIQESLEGERVKINAAAADARAALVAAGGIAPRPALATWHLPRRRRREPSHGPPTPMQAWRSLMQRRPHTPHTLRRRVRITPWPPLNWHWRSLMEMSEWSPNSSRRSWMRAPELMRCTSRPCRLRVLQTRLMPGRRRPLPSAMHLWEQPRRPWPPRWATRTRSPGSKPSMPCSEPKSPGSQPYSRTYRRRTRRTPREVRPLAARESSARFSGSGRRRARCCLFRTGPGFPLDTLCAWIWGSAGGGQRWRHPPPAWAWRLPRRWRAKDARW